MINNLDETLAALADPTRRQVVALLARGPRRAGELAAAAGASGPAMSRHLRVLRATGLIEEGRMEGDARVRLYRLRPDPFLDLQAWLGEIETFWRGQLGSFQYHVERTRKGEHE